MGNEYLTPDEVVELTWVSKAALAQRRYRGLPPNFYKPTGKVVLYKKSEVMDWVERSAVTSSASANGTSGYEQPGY